MGHRLHHVVVVTGLAMMIGAFLFFCLKSGQEPFLAYFGSMILALLGAGVMLLGRSLEKDANSDSKE